MSELIRNNYSLPFNVDPSSLDFSVCDYTTVNELYRKYQKELIPFCKEMRQVRQKMLDHGFSADLSDREAELLYLLIREQKPSVVVEISPNCGYSTNYILAALTHNNKGKLFSYEIQREVDGCPISDVIFHNIGESFDKSRLQLTVGDATQASLPPEYEFLFLDSNHESWFAAWYLNELVPTPEIVFVHDILISNKRAGYFFPKASQIGNIEQYYLLQALHLNQVRFFSVAGFCGYLSHDIRESIFDRFGKDYSDRSIVFMGHHQSIAASEMHKDMQEIQGARLQAFVGDREAARVCYEKYANGDYPLFIQFMASLLYPQLGYRYPTSPEVFNEIKIDYRHLTVAELSAALEFTLTSFNMKQFHELTSTALRKSKIHKRTGRHLIDQYKHIRRGYSTSSLLDLKNTISRFGELISGSLRIH
jgi:predicted O-methyltransferase YrrM